MQIRALFVQTGEQVRVKIVQAGEDLSVLRVRPNEPYDVRLKAVNDGSEAFKVKITTRSIRSVTSLIAYPVLEIEGRKLPNLGAMRVFRPLEVDKSK